MTEIALSTRLRARCVARLYTEAFYGHSPQCRSEAVEVVEGHALCWTHAITLRLDMASLQDVLTGTRPRALANDRELPRLRVSEGPSYGT